MVPQEYRCAQLGVNQLGRQCGQCADSHRCPCAYAKGCGREMVLASFIAPGGVSEFCFSGTCSKMSKLHLHCVPRCTSDWYFHAVCGLFSLLSFQEQPQCLWALSDPSLLSFRTSNFKPHCFQELTKFVPSHFPSQLLWEIVFPVWFPVC